MVRPARNHLELAILWRNYAKDSVNVGLDSWAEILAPRNHRSDALTGLKIDRIAWCLLGARASASLVNWQNSMSYQNVI